MAAPESRPGTGGAHLCVRLGEGPPRPQRLHGPVSLQGHGLQHRLLVTQLPLRLLELGSGLGKVRGWAQDSLHAGGGGLWGASRPPQGGRGRTPAPWPWSGPAPAPPTPGSGPSRCCHSGAASPGPAAPSRAPGSAPSPPPGTAAADTWGTQTRRRERQRRAGPRGCGPIPSGPPVAGLGQGKLTAACHGPQPAGTSARWAWRRDSAWAGLRDPGQRGHYRTRETQQL